MPETGEPVRVPPSRDNGSPLVDEVTGHDQSCAPIMWTFFLSGVLASSCEIVMLSAG